VSIENKTAPEVSVAGLACSKCGASLPEGAQFCLKCGKPVAIPAKADDSDAAPEVEILPPIVPRKPRKPRHVVLWSLLALFVIGVVWAVTSDTPVAQDIQEVVGWKHDQGILENPFTVGARTFRFYKFSLPEGSMHVSMIGQFAVVGDKRTASKSKDSDQDIEVFVLTEPAFAIWQNGYATSSVYESGRVAEGQIQTELPAGAGIYYLVFSNKFAPKTAKNVNANVLLRYKSWLPRWFRSVKERVLGWVGL
jgi:hypothetical protein